MERPEKRGDQYTYIALEERTKLVLAWHLGKRDSANTDVFTDKIRQATNDERLFDVSTDAFAPYERSIERNLFDRANHSRIVKLFSHHVEPGRERYTPKFVSVAKDVVTGGPTCDVRRRTSGMAICEGNNIVAQSGWRETALFLTIRTVRRRRSPHPE